MAIGNSNDIGPGQTERQVLQWRLDTDPAYLNKCFFDVFDAAITTCYVDYRILIPEDATPEQLQNLDISTLSLNFTWGVGVAGQACGNANQSAQTDLIRGMWISVPATSLHVSASYPVLPDPAFQPVVSISALVGKGSKAPAGLCGVPRKSFDTGTLSSGQTSSGIPIPKFAVSVLVESSQPFVSGDATLSQFTGNTTLAQSNPLGDKVIDQVPVANGALTLTVRNNTAGNRRFRVIFYLAL